MMGGDDITKEGSVSPDVVPLTRSGNEEDAGGALLFMCSRAGAYTSKPFCFHLVNTCSDLLLDGNILISDGGRMSIVPATY